MIKGKLSKLCGPWQVRGALEHYFLMNGGMNEMNENRRKTVIRFQNAPICTMIDFDKKIIPVLPPENQQMEAFGLTTWSHSSEKCFLRKLYMAFNKGSSLRATSTRAN